MSPQPIGPVRCPTCQQKALPLQTFCSRCGTRLGKASSETIKAAEDGPAPTAALPRTDGLCPACGKTLSATAVLCIDCGFDLRTGRMLETVRVADEENAESDSPGRKRKSRAEPLPAGMGKVQRGLAIHYAQLVLTLLSVFVLTALACYAAAMKPAATDAVVMLGALTASGLWLLTAVLGIVGSVLCLWVGRASRAWWFILISLLLDLLTLPLIVGAQVASIPPFVAWPAEFASWICFMLFLRRLALYVDRPDEAREAMGFIKQGIALFVLVPLLLVLFAMMAFLGALSSEAAVPVFLVASTLVLVVQFILLILLFFGILANIQILRAAINSRLTHREETEEQPLAV